MHVKHPIEFNPAKLLNKGWLQTLAGYYIPSRPKNLTGVEHQIKLVDGDVLIAIENRPLQWKFGDRIILLVHGLTGSHQSKYMLRLAAKLIQHNHLVIRLNLRGCGPGFGLAKQPYHSGRSDDTRQVINWIANNYPTSPVTQIGFSLGGNITLKMAGEDGAAAPGNLDSVVAVSPPVDLSLSTDHITKHGKLFEQYFVKQLCKEAERVSKHYLDLPVYTFPSKLSLRMFDDIYTASRGGFRSAEDYYQRSSAKPLLGNIKIPTLILAAKDDPVVATHALEDVVCNPEVEICITEAGGHLGYISNYRADYGIRWMDYYLLRWLDPLRRTIAT